MNVVVLAIRLNHSAPKSAPTLRTYLPRRW
jgi:hypothetical protein